jgi:phage N-6-adenine-methyltransferase
MNNDLMFSRKEDGWETPQDFFDRLDAEFNFTLDPSCTAETAKCRKFYTTKEDGLAQSWEGETVYCNPPYGRVIADWVRKAYEESRKPFTTVVMLLPARTDTKWFHGYIYGKAEVRFIPGRLKFGGSPYNAPFPNMIVIFR